MPVCFSLTYHGLTSPAPLGQVDAHICQALDLPFDDDEYVGGWYEYIGLRLATGQSFARIATGLQASIAEWPESAWYYWRLLRITHFLAEHYTTDAWREFGR